MTAPGSVLLLDPSKHAHLVPFLAGLHGNCITHDHVIASFRPPLSPDKLLQYWRERLVDVKKSKCVIFIHVAQAAGDGARVQGKDLKGVVMMILREGDTGSHRGHVEGLMVSSDRRRQGIGRTLMEALESDAREAGRTLLTLKAERESLGSDVFKRFGYAECGVIPDDAQSPAGGLRDSTIFFKRLGGS